MSAEDLPGRLRAAAMTDRGWRVAALLIEGAQTTEYWRTAFETMRDERDTLAAVSARPHPQWAKLDRAARRIAGLEAEREKLQRRITELEGACVLSATQAIGRSAEDLPLGVQLAAAEAASTYWCGRFERMRDKRNELAGTWSGCETACAILQERIAELEAEREQFDPNPEPAECGAIWRDTYTTARCNLVAGHDGEWHDDGLGCWPVERVQLEDPAVAADADDDIDVFGDLAERLGIPELRREVMALVEAADEAERRRQDSAPAEARCHLDDLGRFAV